MGCYPPLVKIVSKALRKCSGRERWREGRLDFDYAVAYPPGPPTETHYMRPVARTVTFASTNSIHVIPPSAPPPPPPQQQQQSTPEPQQPQAPPRHAEQHHDETPESQPPQPQAETTPEPPPPAQTQDAPPPQAAEQRPPRGPRRGKKKQPGHVRFGPEPAPPPPQQQEEQEEAEQEGPEGNGEKAPPDHQGPHHGAPSAPAPTPAYLLRYTPSPLPRWEATPRRHEYFSGEYRSYYPTPVREGIYRIATDANRLTTIFSEENPNACTIV